VIEGISIMLTRVTAPPPPQPMAIDMPPAAAAPARSAEPTPTAVSSEGYVSEHPGEGAIP
jgi:hypothetical protein